MYRVRCSCWLASYLGGACPRFLLVAHQVCGGAEALQRELCFVLGGTSRHQVEALRERFEGSELNDFGVELIS